MKWIHAVLVLALASSAAADEGMWLFNRFPSATVKEKYGVDVSPQMLAELRLATVRLGSATGAVVSPNGLLLANQHIFANCLAGDSLRDGFVAASSAEEKRCAGMDAKILLAVDDVTAQFPAPTQKRATAERAALVARLETECAAARPGETCEVVSLFSGSRYEVYRYKRYSDVRLVFAPEQQVAFFGRERDSITYLRYGLDVVFARLYEDGKPAATPHFLKWSSAELKEGDFVMASGNPRTTVRETTAAQLTFYRDTLLPLQLARLAKRIAALGEYSAKSQENRRRAEPQRVLFLEEYKSAAGKLIGLRDDRLVTRKTAFDGKIRRAVEADAKLGTDAGKVWDQVATAYKTWAPSERAYQILEAEPAPGSNLFRMARAILRGEKVESVAEMDESLEITFVTQYLEELKDLAEHGGPRGEKDKEIKLKEILGGQTPQAAAEAFVKSSHLQSRRQREANSEDGMIRLAEMLEPAAQRIRKKHEETIVAVDASAAAQIAQYRYRLFGDAEYPDATGTPRVEFGVLKSYTDRAGVSEPYAATFSGMFYRRNNQGPYQVPERWVQARTALHEVTPLDFVSTCDIGGGEAGAPTVNRAGELVGIVFDGNLESLPNTYLYTDDQARAVHVATEGIAEALAKVYRAQGLLKELGLGEISTARVR